MHDDTAVQSEDKQHLPLDITAVNIHLILKVRYNDPLVSIALLTWHGCGTHLCFHGLEPTMS